MVVFDQHCFFVALSIIPHKDNCIFLNLLQSLSMATFACGISTALNLEFGVCTMLYDMETFPRSAMWSL